MDNIIKFLPLVGFQCSENKDGTSTASYKNEDGMELLVSINKALSVVAIYKGMRHVIIDASYIDHLCTLEFSLFPNLFMRRHFPEILEAFNDRIPDIPREGLRTKKELSNLEPQSQIEYLKPTTLASAEAV